jgi:hypothetical protein
VIVRLTAELAAARKELVEQRQATQSRQQTSEFSPSAIWHVGYNLFMEDRTKGGRG